MKKKLYGFISLFIFLFLFLADFVNAQGDPEDIFSAVWDTTKTGTGSSNTTNIVLPITGTYLVDWGDGTSNNSVATHTYATPGTYTINITNTGITGFGFNNSGDKLKIINITQWGDLFVGNSNGYFYGCSNMNFIGTDSLDLTGTTDLQNMFRSASTFNGNISNRVVNIIVTSSAHHFAPFKKLTMAISI